MKKNKIYIKSYGCQMNIYDSNRILDLFKNKDYVITKNPEDANLVVLNTCHIREKAAEKVYIVGNSKGNIDGQTNAGPYDTILMKFDLSGTWEWTRLAGGSDSEM